MESFEKTFSDHPVHEVLSQAEARLSEPSKRELNEDAVKYLDRVQQGVQFIRSRLEVSSPVLATANQLAGIQTSLQRTLNELNQFEGSGNTGHLANASNQIDSGLNIAATLVSLQQPQPEIKASDATDFKKLANQVIQSLRDDVDKVKSESKEANEELGQLSTDMSQQAKQLATLEAQISSKLEELQSLFASAQTERESSFDSLVEMFEKGNTEHIEELTKSTQEAVEYIEEKRKEAEKKVHLIGNIGLTGNFRLAAKREGLLANIFRVVALLCFLGMVSVILYMGFISLNEKFDLWLAVFRFAIGFAFLVPGVYAARESTKHRNLENKNRRDELELASIDSYLNSLPPEKRNEIKSELSLKYFGNNDFEITDEENIVTAKSLFKVFSDVAVKLASK